MHYLLPRSAESVVRTRLQANPAVALLGPRQAGKSTLAHVLLASMGDRAVYLDLERPSDLRKLSDPEVYLHRQAGRLVCLDEIQRRPDLFPVLRSVIDAAGSNGQFLILGSASPELLRQGSETLAGRLALVELTPFGLGEVEDPARLWVRGGFPRSYLAGSEADSFTWRLDFIRTFLEHDVPQMGFRLPAESVRRLWQMLAHSQGQVLNSSKIGAALGLSHTTVRTYIDLFAAAFLVRLLPPWLGNLKKRLVRSPKVYLRDSGILHALLELESFDRLAGHPVYGHSFEGLVIENVIAALSGGWRFSFYRTARGAEIDLVLERAGRRIAIECKASSAPDLEPGFHRACEDLAIEQTLVVAPVDESYPLGTRILAVPPAEAVRRASQGFGQEGT
jgi:predicted AAA+ superfamily ATPase